MTYQKGSKILAADFNGFLTTVNNVYAVGNADRGYGQTAISQAAVSIGGKILATQWTNLHDMIVVCANQQNTNVTSLPSDNFFVAGKAVIAHEQAAPSNNTYELANNITAIDANRLNVASTALSVTSSSLTVTRATSWTVTISAEISATWSNEDNARFFFNSGGLIRMTGAQPTTSGRAQDIDWNNSLGTVMGLVTLGAHHTQNAGTTSGGTSLGYYELTDSYQNVYVGTNLNNAGAYTVSADNVTIAAKRLNYVGSNGGNGNGVQIKITLTDSGSYSSVTTSAGTNFVFGFAKATTFLSGIASPTFATVTNF